MSQAGTGTGLSRWVIQALVLIFMFGFTLPLFDHHAVERDPWHKHIVLGGSSIERARAAVYHRHDYDQPHHHATNAAAPSSADAAHHHDPDDPSVVVVRSFDGIGASFFGALGKIALVLVTPLRPPVLPLLDLVYPVARFLSGIDPPVPKPPPRVSF